MNRVFGRREFVGAAASVAAACLMPEVGHCTAELKDSYTSASIMIGKKYAVPSFSPEEYRRRWRVLQELMGKREIECLLIMEPRSIHYVANLPGYREEDDNFCVVPAQGTPSLFLAWGELYCYAQDISAIPEIVSLSTLFSKEKAASGSSDNSLGPLVEKIRNLGLEKSTIGVDSLTSRMKVSTFTALQKEFPSARFVDASELLVSCCMVRSDEEIGFFRRSREIGERAFLAMVHAAKPGVTEKQLLGACVGSLISDGADMQTRIMHTIAHWPDPRSASNYAYPYHQGGTERKLQKGDIVLMELYSSYSGYYSDVCLPIAVGKPPQDFIERFEICKEMIDAARSVLRPGKTQDEVDAAVMSCLTSKLKRQVDIRSVADLKPFAIEPGHGIKGELKPGMVINVPPKTTWDQGPNHICGETLITTAGTPEKIGNLPIEIAIV